jgi:hypothetical protein
MTVSGFWRTQEETVGKLWTTNGAYARLIFHATMAMDWFLQILCILRLNHNTIRNQRRSKDKLAPIKDVFESISSRFQMAHTHTK